MIPTIFIVIPAILLVVLALPLEVAALHRKDTRLVGVGWGLYLGGLALLVVVAAVSWGMP